MAGGAVLVRPWQGWIEQGKRIDGRTQHELMYLLDLEFEMLDDYRPVMLHVSFLLAIYAVTYISAPITPSNILEYGLLAIASVWLFYGALLLQKERRRASSVFYGAVAVLPWAFYGELWYINNNKDGIDPKVFEANMQHAIFVYQSFKYIAIGCGTIVALISLYRAVRSFGSTT